MKLFKTLKTKKLALYTAIILGTSIFTVACDNSKTDVIASKPAEMSQQQRNDFIKQVFTHFAAKLNSTNELSTVTLESFETSPNEQTITITMKSSIQISDDSPVIFNSIYLITPDQSLQNDQYTVAKFTVQNNLVENQKFSDNLTYNFGKQFIENSSTEQVGYVMASGDITSAIQTKNTLNLTNNSAYNPITLSLLPFTADYQTKDNMNVIDSSGDIPLVAVKFGDINFSIKNTQVKMLNHTLDANYQYSGQDTYLIDSMDLTNKDRHLLLNNINIETNTNTNDKGYTNQYNTGSFSGNFKHNEKTYDFFVSGKIDVENLNLEAVKKFQEYKANAVYNYSNHSDEEIKLLTNIIEDGFSLAMRDVDVTLNGDKGNFNFIFEIPAMKITNKSNRAAMGMQVFNNLNISVNTTIPVQWLRTLELAPGSSDSLDRMINQSIEQIDTMGYQGAMSYDGKTIKANFDIKKGSVFVNGELKGSLLNTIAAFM